MGEKYFTKNSTNQRTTNHRKKYRGLIAATLLLLAISLPVTAQELLQNITKMSQLPENVRIATPDVMQGIQMINQDRVVLPMTSQPNLEVSFNTQVSTSNTPTNGNRMMSECDFLESKWLTPAPSPSVWSFGPDDYLTGLPAPTLHGVTTAPFGVYELYTTPTPGTTLVGSANVGLGGLVDPNDNMEFQVVIYEADATGTPTTGIPVGGVGGISPTLLGVPAGLFYAEFIFEMATPPITSTHFLVAVEMFPGDTTDGLIVVSSAAAQGLGAGENFGLSDLFGYWNYLGLTGLDVDMLMIPKLGEFAAVFYDEAGFSNCEAVDPMPTLFGVAGGTYSSTPAGLALNTSTGEIDASASAPGSYVVSYVTPAGCDSFINASVDIVNPTTTYSGGLWDNGAPTSTSNAVFSENYNTSAGNIDACTCQIEAGATVTVGANEYMQVDRDIDVDGTLIIEHQGSLVQTDPLAVVDKNAFTGVINVEVTTPTLDTRDFIVLGSPMDADTRTGVFASALFVAQHTPANFIPNSGVPAGGTNFSDDDGNFWNAITSGTINAGEGFLVRPQSGYFDPAQTYDLTFSEGTITNGDVTRTMVYNTSGNPDGTPNIYANPYPSAIDANSFLTDNGLTELYFWEHLTPPSAALPGAYSLNFSMDDISIWNGTMGIPAANDTGMTTAPNGVIASAQGFGIKAVANGSVTFTNDMRLNSGNTTLRLPESIETITINVRNDEYGIGSFAGIAFRAQGSQEFNPFYDTQRLATTVSIYSHLQDGSEQLGIQTLGMIEPGMKIPVGFASQVAAETEFTISLADVSGETVAGSSIYLIDNYKQTITDLTVNNYEFISDKGTFNERFTVQFEYEVLGTDTQNLSTISVYPNPAREVLNISSPAVGIDSVEIIDLQGRTIQTIDGSQQSSLQLSLSGLEASLYMVSVKTVSGTLTKRIVKY